MIPGSKLREAIKLQLAGDRAEAEARYRALLRTDPRNVGALQNLGLIESETSRYEAAEKHFRLALRHAPKSADLWLALARMLVRLEIFPRAITAFEAVLKLDPRSANAHGELAGTLHTLKRFDRAIVHYSKAIELGGDNATLHNEAGVAYRMLGRMEEAYASFERALALDPHSAPIQSNMGSILLERGEIKRAAASFERAWEIAPTEMVYLHNLTEAKTFRVGDPKLPQYLATTERLGPLPLQGEVHRHFALAKIYSDLGDHHLASLHLQRGNRAKRSSIEYDERNALGDLDRIAKAFSPELIAGLSGNGEQTTLPVFIVGLPRSGSTLVNQILGSHSQVHGAGEVDIFGACVNELVGSKYRNDSMPPVAELCARLDRKGVVELGRRYAKRIQQLSPGSNRIIDKLLSNFRCVGLIHLALPNARIIHVSRNPADLALSCYSKLFQGEHPYTYDLRELGRYYRAYEKLMAHWERVLPSGSILQVRYEKLVSDLESETRRMLAFCGLEWEAGCLDFHEAGGWVRTASAAQVRKPLYTSSVNRAEAYRELLAPFLEERDRA